MPGWDCRPRKGLKRPIKQPRRVLKAGNPFHAPIAMGRAKGYYPWVERSWCPPPGRRGDAPGHDVEADLLYAV